MGKPSFKYKRRERTVEDIRRKASENSRDYDTLFKGDVKLFKPGDGENIIRIMGATWGMQPYTDEELDKMSEKEIKELERQEEVYGNGWDLPIFVHYGVGPDEGAYLCRDKMLGERCPICEAKAAARDPDEADALAPSKRALAWIIDRNAEKEGPQIWSMPFQKIRNEIYSRSIDKKHGTPILIDDHEEGFDIIFNRSGKDKRTSYTGVEVDRDPSPLHENEKKQQQWLDYIRDNPLQDLLNFYDPEHIEKVLFGRAPSRRSRDADADAGDASDAPERGGRSSRRSSPRRPSSDHDDTEKDYLDPDDAADDDDDEGAAPERSSRSSRARRGDDRSDDPDDAGESTGRGSPRRASARRAAPEQPDDDPDAGEEEGADAPDAETAGRSSRRGRGASRGRSDGEDADAESGDAPSDQARGRLRGLRDRRGR